MASPPLSADELRARAKYVYVGTVQDVRERPAGELTEVEADLDIEACEKKLLLAKSGTITIRYRRPGELSPGTTGSFGQHSPLHPGARVRVFLDYDADGRAWLLEPNGWEPA